MTALPLQTDLVSSPSSSSPSPPSSLQHVTASASKPLLLDDEPLSAPGSTPLTTASASSSSSSGTAIIASTSNPAASGGSHTTAGPSRDSAARPLDGGDDSESDWDIEMEPIAGHRRRRSSHNMATRPAGSPSRLRGTSRGPAPTTSLNEPKISEEDIDANGVAVRKDESADDSFSDEDLQDDEETGLTRKDKQRRQKKRSRNTQLDQRIARDRKDVSTEERKEADKTVLKSLMINGVLILLWYLFSLSISIYNKWMFDHDRLNFAFPLFTTSMHMVVQFVLSALVLYFIPSLRPGYRAHQSDLGSSRHDDEPKSYGMTKMFYLTRIGPCGAATGLDIGLGNTSLKFISLTFYTMCKSSSLAFVLMFAFVFRLETPTLRLIAIIATMTMGVVLMVFGEVEFKAGGFALVISAAFFSGFRWGLTQILLLRNPATSNPFSSIFFLTPVMFLVLICLAVPVEGVGPLIEGYKVLGNEWGFFMAPLFLLFPGCIAFCMTASEFALLQRTSVVTLSIAGIFKEVVTISAAALVFGDRLTAINFVGLLTTMAAIAAYNYIKINKMRQEARESVHGQHADDGDDSDFPGSQTSGVIDRDGDTDAENTGLLRDSIDRLDIDDQPHAAANERR
ncbi:Gog5p-like vanadate resistance protein [Fusarium heterosporum]|uniref:Gog5p-like vanadate resistance protein n=1 Tax=Fusarium heterosporum TaxID=42747 RepID=A0A8H5TMU1_FUSHE|nr:Gog5p-like vanadate resistance protein [Fusarium heterosporum]